MAWRSRRTAHAAALGEPDLHELVRSSRRAASTFECRRRVAMAGYLEQLFPSRALVRCSTRARSGRLSGPYPEAEAVLSASAVCRGHARSGEARARTHS